MFFAHLCKTQEQRRKKEGLKISFEWRKTRKTSKLLFHNKAFCFIARTFDYKNLLKVQQNYEEKK